MGDFRWDQLTGNQDGLFAQPSRVVGRGEYRGLTFHEVEARSIINPSPPGTPWFNYTINAYRGCSHACTYCLSGDTQILMADGRIKQIADVRVGDRVYGTERHGTYRRFVDAVVLDQWCSVRPALRVTCSDGSTVIASPDHRFLTDQGWKYITAAEQGTMQRPHLTLNNRVIGLGPPPAPPKQEGDYKLGYLCGMLRGNGRWGTYSYSRPGRTQFDVHRFRLALADHEALERARAYLTEFGVDTDEFVFSPATETYRQMRAIRSSKRSSVESVRRIVEWPVEPSDEWSKGFLAGIFDAEGSYSTGVLRISNMDRSLIEQINRSLTRLQFSYLVEATRRVKTVRIIGGRPEHLRFFLSVDPAITRKRSFTGTAVKLQSKIEVTSIEHLGFAIPMFDLTTTTGDFIANGLISHNCFARPTHEYLGFDMGKDFETQIVVKVNAVDLVRAETAPGRWGGDSIAMGTNTDPYQAAEGKYRLTKGVIEVLVERENPFSILTKSPLVLRDLDLIVEASKRAEIRVDFSIPTLDQDVWRRTEPGTPHPRKRIEAVGRFNEAGVKSGVMMAPLMPGISDSPEQIAAVKRAARNVGAQWCHEVKLHLRGVRGHFLDWLEKDNPDLLPSYKQLYPPPAPTLKKRPARQNGQLPLEL